MKENHPPYAGKILRINLETGKIETQPTTDYSTKFLGGRGINQWILYREVPANIEPFDPSNKLIFGAGVLVGTSAPTACRLAIDTLNPYTKGVGSANAGGHFSPMMKYAGYDHIVIEQKASSPAYIWIDDENVEIRDATSLWGKNTTSTISQLKNDHSDNSIETALIGPAGENKTRTATIVVSGGRIGGRCGVGAVMGSKNLKAIAIRGTGSIQIENPHEFQEISKKIWKRMQNNPSMQDLRKHGTVNVVQYENPDGYLPVRNNLDDHLDPKILNEFTATKIQNQHLMRRLACFGCPIRCSSLLKVSVDSGRNLPQLVGEGIQASSVNNFGSRLGFTSLEDIVRGHILCTELGIDIDAACNVIAWAIECWNRNLLTEKDTDGNALAWNDPLTVFELLEKMANREGFGAKLADGVVKAAENINSDLLRYGMQVKGQDLYEACRGRKAWSLGVAVDQRGGSHLRGSPVIETPVTSTQNSQKLFGVSTASQPGTWDGKAEIVAYYEDFKGIVDSVNLCYITTIWPSINDPLPIGFGDIAALLMTATGKIVTSDSLRQIGSRIHLIEKAINVRVGMNRKDDKLPNRFFQPAENNPSGPYLDREGFEHALTKYYRFRNWDPKTGLPTIEAYQVAGLSEVAKDLQDLIRSSN